MASGIEFLERFLDKTDLHLGVDQGRYGGGYIAIVLHRSWTNWIFDQLESDDSDACEAQSLLANNLFPTAQGNSLSQSLRRLSAKLDAMYELSDKEGWPGVKPKFSLQAEHDIDADEVQTLYDVNFDDVVNDCRGGSTYWYSEAVEESNKRVKRDLNALVNFKWPDDLNKAVTSAMNLK